MCIFPRTRERNKSVEAGDAGAAENEEGVEREIEVYAGKHTDFNEHIEPVRKISEKQRDLEQFIRFAYRFENSFYRESKRVNKIANKIELMKLNLDNEYKVMKQDCQRYENTLNEYEATWQSYHVRNFHSA